MVAWETGGAELPKFGETGEDNPNNEPTNIIDSEGAPHAIAELDKADLRSHFWSASKILHTGTSAI